MKSFNVVLGIVMTVLGILLLLVNLGMITVDLEILWPTFVLVPGLCFELGYFIRRRDPGLLVPGGILTTYGVLFFINNLWGWNLMEFLWPVFPMGVAIGLFQLYIFGGRENGVLVASAIIGGFSLIALSFTMITFNFNIVMPIVLILLGVLLIFKRK